MIILTMCTFSGKSVCKGKETYCGGEGGVYFPRHMIFRLSHHIGLKSKKFYCLLHMLKTTQKKKTLIKKNKKKNKKKQI